LEPDLRYQNRRIAFAEYGDPAGKPVFLCHGTPSSRLNRPDDETTRALFFYDRWPDILMQLLAAGFGAKNGEA
jgi:pimeloyl-ACP methyl ester carboxylesterase